MHTKYLIFILTLFFITESFPQSKFNLGASFNLGIPSGNFSDLAKTSIGGSINSEYVFNDKISATLAVYYHSYTSEIPPFAVGGASYEIFIDAIPVIGGLRYYFNKDFFGTIEGGAHFMRVKADVYLGDNLSTEYEPKYGGGIGVGYRVSLAPASVFELSGVYQIVQNNLNSVSLRATLLVLFGNL